MRLLTSAAVLSCACAAVLSGAVAGAPAAKPRLVSNRPVETGARWIGVVSASRRPVVTARLGRRSQTVTVRRLRPGRYQLRAIFRQAGRWALWAARQRFGTVLVRQAPLRLTNAMDVVVEPNGSLLVSDFSDRVFRLNGDRLTLLAGNGRPGHTGDGGPAIRAAIGFPVEIAVDPRGGFGIVHGERWVRHVDPSGTITTVAEFQQPTALAYDSAGNLFVSELLGGVKRRDAATGAVTTYAGLQPPARAGGRGRRNGVRRRHVQQPRPADLPRRLRHDSRRRHQPAQRRRARPGREHLFHRLGVEPDPQDHAGRRRDEDRRLPTAQLGRRGRGRHGLRRGRAAGRREANHGGEPRRLQACPGRHALDREVWSPSGGRAPSPRGTA